MRYRPILLWAVGFLVVLDVLARTLATQLPPPRVFANYNIQRQAERVESLDGECLDAVLLGTSLMGAAGRPTEIAEQFPSETSVLNAAVGGGGLLLVVPWIEDLVLASTCPSVAVIGLGPRDANDAFPGPQTTLDAYLESTGRGRAIGDLDVFGHMDQTLERSLGLFQLRTAYREPANAAAFFINGSGDWREATNESGQITFFEYGMYVPDKAREAALTDGAFADFAVGGRNFDALRTAITRLQEAGVEVFVVDMPRVASAHQRLIGADGIAQYETALADTAAQSDVTLLQADEVEVLQNDAIFADEYHLNRSGSLLFSEWLGVQLSAE